MTKKLLLVGGTATIGVLVSLLIALSSTRVAVFVAMGFIVLVAIIALAVREGRNISNIAPSAEEIAGEVVRQLNPRFEELTHDEINRIMTGLPMSPTVSDFETALRDSLRVRRTF